MNPLCTKYEVSRCPKSGISPKMYKSLDGVAGIIFELLPPNLVRIPISTSYKDAKILS